MKSFDFSRKGQTSEVDIFGFMFLKYVLEICSNSSSSCYSVLY